MRSDWLGLSWKATVLRGLLAIVFGVVAMVWPVATVVALALLWGVWALVDGVSEIAQATVPGTQGRGWLVLMGLVSIAAGLWAVVVPGVAAVTLTWVLGIWLLVRGVFELVGAFSSGHVLPRWLLVVSAVLSVVLGVLFVANPGTAAVTLAVWLGVTALAWGIVFVVIGLVLRRALADVTAAPVADGRRRHATAGPEA
ncbi:HdeD family acid-resistance protein [Cellulomonas sp. NS3]|uniref:HdeD family acid-resistance protein n=1 Tax=Cellulomonas sp. NS3 TaxID=2973977 RepID=UPI002161EC0A|nr:DUF308 domain-containing protein [Cellulomonas sp. NS3]